MNVFTKDCEITDHNSKDVRRLARRLEAVAKEINEMGLEIFGSEGSALYIVAPHEINPCGREPHVLADIEQRGNGGSLQCREQSDCTHSLCG